MDKRDHMSNLQSRTILSIDDDRLVLKVVRVILGKGGYTNILTASSAEKGLQLVQDSPPDLVICDLMMPGMDGFQFCREMRAREATRHIPVIILTASTQRDAIEESFQSGATDFVKKPIDGVEFLSRVRTALTLKQTFDLLHEELRKRREAEESVRRQNQLLNDAYQDLESLHGQLRHQYEIAGEIFSRTVFKETLEFPNLKILSSPAEIVSGDVIYVAARRQGGLVLLLGDFTGHGLSAALGAIPTSEIFYALTEQGYSISDIVAAINRKLKVVLPTGLFLCACLIELNAAHDTIAIWNGGLPDVLIVGERGDIKDRISSSHLPLGVVDSDQLDSREHVVKVHRGDRVYIYSDGVIELRCQDHGFFGQERLETLLSAALDTESLFDKLAHNLRSWCDGKDQEDDFIIAELTCDSLKDTGTRGHEVALGSPRWTLSVELGPDHLRRDPLQLFIQLLNDFEELREHKENTYLILSELLSNALDYGVLRLDPELKAGVQGFEEYHSTRLEALTALETGWIKVDLQFHPLANSGKLTVSVKDSGPGFQWSRIGETPPDLTLFRGRGISLVRSICESVSYKGKGNWVEAVYVCQ
jgi:CheY-like chemotaxis protein